MKKEVLIFAKMRDRKAKALSTQLSEWLKGQGLRVLDVTGSEERISNSAVKSIVLGLSIGGDGTLLVLVRRLEKKDAFPLMGINLGTLGFLTETGRDEMFSAIEPVLHGGYSEESRDLLGVELLRKEKSVLSTVIFNDVVIYRGVKTSMINLDVLVEGTILSQLRADGYIVATSTGSTGYALSAGGPVIHPRLGAMVLVPLCSHSLSARPVVLPNSLCVELSPGDFRGKAYLVCDGQLSEELIEGDRIKVTASGTHVRLVRFPHQNWAEVLRSKLKMV